MSQTQIMSWVNITNKKDILFILKQLYTEIKGGIN